MLPRRPVAQVVPSLLTQVPCNNGAFSGVRGALRADANGLTRFSNAALEHAFQIGPTNPLAGAAGRAALLRSLGQVVATTPGFFGAEAPRLGNLGLFLKQQAHDGRLQASAVLRSVLEALGPIWPGRQRLAGKNLGDVFDNCMKTIAQRWQLPQNSQTMTFKAQVSLTPS